MCSRVHDSKEQGLSMVQKRRLHIKHGGVDEGRYVGGGGDWGA